MIQIPTTEQVRVADIKSDGKNPNRMSPENFKALKRNIEKWGFLIPIITNNDLVLADGEHRLQAAKELGMDAVSVIRLPVSEVDRRMIRQIMNKLRGEHDAEKDLEEYAFINGEGQYEDFLSLLPSMKDFEDVPGLGSPEVDPEDFDTAKAVQAPKYPVIQGQIFQLGRHRLMCGDSTKSEDVDKLIGNKKVDLVFTDPPYGVSYTGTNNPNGKEWKQLINDDLRGEVLKQFLKSSFTNVKKHMKVKAALYSCYASINHMEFEEAIKESGLKVKQVLIWDKGHILGHSDYHWCHEPILYCCDAKENSTWYGDRTEKTILENTWADIKNHSKEELLKIIEQIREDSDVIRIRKDAASTYVHPTQKPIELPKRIIRNSSEIQAIVCDIFGGSGSTLLACEQTKRECLCMELDPRYVSAIIERWEKLTGEEAVIL